MFTQYLDILSEIFQEKIKYFLEEEKCLPELTRFHSTTN